MMANLCEYLNMCLSCRCLTKAEQNPVSKYGLVNISMFLHIYIFTYVSMYIRINSNGLIFVQFEESQIVFHNKPTFLILGCDYFNFSL